MMINTKTGIDEVIAEAPAMDLLHICFYHVCWYNDTHFSICFHSRIFWKNTGWQYDDQVVYGMG